MVGSSGWQWNGVWEVTARVGDKEGEGKEMKDTRDKLWEEKYVGLILCVCVWTN